VNNILAKTLRKGDTIGIISPSMPLVLEEEEQFNKGVEYFKRLGFNIKLGKYIRSDKLGYGATPEEKAEDLNEMFADKKVKAVICSQGGITCNNCLDVIDWECIRDNPKIFLGISDITVLLNSIYKKTGLITFHGNDVVWGYGRSCEEYENKELISRLIDGKTGEITARKERLSIRNGIAEGKLLGGNLRCLLKLAGTEYFPDFSDSILFLEDIGVSPAECDSNLYHLKQMGVFDKVKGVVIGYIDGMDNSDATPKLEGILKRITTEYSFPILKIYELGHNCQNAILPVGAKVKINAQEKSVSITESYLKK
jgi:muramoyltetrapeptide carboxypeptidase